MSPFWAIEYALTFLNRRRCCMIKGPCELLSTRCTEHVYEHVNFSVQSWNLQSACCYTWDLCFCCISSRGIDVVQCPQGRVGDHAGFDSGVITAKGREPRGWRDQVHVDRPSIWESGATQEQVVWIVARPLGKGHSKTWPVPDGAGLRWGIQIPLPPVGNHAPRRCDGVLSHTTGESTGGWDHAP